MKAARFFAVWFVIAFAALLIVKVGSMAMQGHGAASQGMERPSEPPAVVAPESAAVLEGLWLKTETSGSTVATFTAVGTLQLASSANEDMQVCLPDGRCRTLAELAAGIPFGSLKAQERR